MSVKVMSLAFYVDGLSPAQKAVLVALADHANEDGRHAYPGVERLARKTSYTERTVRRALKDLREMSLIRVIRESKHHRPTEYIIDLTEMQAKQDRPDTVSPHDLTEDPSDLTEDPKRPDTVSPKPSVNHQEPSAAARAPEGYPEAKESFENHIAMTTPAIDAKLRQWVERVGGQWVIDAVMEAVNSKVHKPNYVWAILERWEREGRGPRFSDNGKDEKQALFEEANAYAEGRRPFTDLSPRAQQIVRDMGGDHVKNLGETAFRVEFYRVINNA